MKPPAAVPCHGDPATPLARALEQPYRHGFFTDVESDALPPGLDELTLGL